MEGFTAAAGWKALGLVLISFVSEDAATWSGASLVGTGGLPLGLGFAACSLGIWAGDLGLFFAAYFFGPPLLKLSFFAKRYPPERREKAQAWLQRQGIWLLLLSRCLPGTRQPVYLTAGLLRYPPLLFALLTGAAALVWVGAIFWLVARVGLPVFDLVTMMHHSLRFYLIGLLLLIFFPFFLPLEFSILTKWRKRLCAWEFWPAPIFYAPVALFYLFLGLRYRGFTLPMLANPGIYTGGMIGESKDIILRQLEQTSPEFTAKTVLLRSGSKPDRYTCFDSGLDAAQLTYPVVLKPAIGQRGAGFCIIRNREKAIEYLNRVDGDVLLQEYLPGPYEVGVFYVRYPDWSRGEIFSITEKIFPVAVGNGFRTLAQLIEADPRARCLASVYRRRFHSRLDEVLPADRKLRLVEAGNHAQGCIFQEGNHLLTAPLAARMDEIACRLPGFFIGRFDLRYTSSEALSRGEGFKILELNGASSEATNIYDARNSLFSAYRTLFRQWQHVFAIGAANRARGAARQSLITLLREWWKYQKQASSYPHAD